MRFALVANLRALRNQRGEALRNLHRFAGADANDIIQVGCDSVVLYVLFDDSC